jgi:hypothetical protein
VKEKNGMKKSKRKKFWQRKTQDDFFLMKAKFQRREHSLPAKPNWIR